jgi:F-type H+-transporting ATPase subunit b
MPQLAQASEIYASQLFWLAIVFGLIYFVIGRMMVPKIQATVDDRQAKITADLTAAAAARATATASEDGHHAAIDAARARALSAVNTAKASGTAAAETRIKAADDDHAAMVAAAESRIATAKGAALGEIESFTVDAVAAIVAKISGADADRAVIQQHVAMELSNG